ncbi:ferritin heavy chain isoform X1 [Drosophila erecta]|uniref:ferritin heavy chain isoform X1 n=1 Tax=Drosophila erecta TaxID=7220 RepID=UPI000F057B9A|nr:ferritin heavy chain isoform X1 [Drosophila erecta]XP_026839774.1 ferritin heavy chain isoform X1 [Drosophila erecta]
MKFLVALALFACLGSLALAVDNEYCQNTVITACSSSAFSALTGFFTGKSNSICNARFAGIDHIEPEVQSYINANLAKSYDYLLLATHFNSYQKNRPGFQKLYQGLSDRSFEDSIALIKQVTRRGGIVDFNTRHESAGSVSTKRGTLEVDELHSLALALDTEKQLATGATHVHSRATHAADAERDPELAHYFEENFLGKQAESVRKLSGYANDLAKLMKVPDPSLSVYLFDEYLQKQ